MGSDPRTSPSMPIAGAGDIPKLGVLDRIFRPSAVASSSTIHAITMRAAGRIGKLAATGAR
jgi:hypothetical protein